MIAPTKTAYAHIEFDENGRAVIAGTRFKVRVFVEIWKGNGWSPEEMHEQYPFLSMAQIHSAFAYYWDHKDEIEQAIAESDAMVERYRQENPESPAQLRLRELARQYAAEAE